MQAKSPVPVAVGFGISTSADAAAVGSFADAVVVGSALVKIIETHGKSDDLLPRVREFITSLKEGRLIGLAEGHHEDSCTGLFRLTYSGSIYQQLAC